MDSCTGPFIGRIQSAVTAGALQIPTPVCVIPASPRVIPAKAGIQYVRDSRIRAPWIPAFAGKTQGDERMTLEAGIRSARENNDA
jgi:hypothetical protein